MKEIKVLGKRVAIVERPEECEITVRLVPNDFYKRTGIPAEEKADADRAAEKLTLSDLRIGRREGDIYLISDYLRQYFDVEADEGPWKYDGGEVHTHQLSFDRLEVV
jgi:hypothetical protein